MILSPTSQISHHHKVTNITMSPTSLSPLLTPDKLNEHFLVWTIISHEPHTLHVQCFLIDIIMVNEVNNEVYDEVYNELSKLMILLTSSTIMISIKNHKTCRLYTVEYEVHAK